MAEGAIMAQMPWVNYSFLVVLKALLTGEKCVHKPIRWSMSGKLISSRGEPATITLLRTHCIRPPSKYVSLYPCLSAVLNSHPKSFILQRIVVNMRLTGGQNVCGMLRPKCGVHIIVPTPESKGMRSKRIQKDWEPEAGGHDKAIELMNSQQHSTNWSSRASLSANCKPWPWMNIKKCRNELEKKGHWGDTCPGHMKNS